jgi:hypothetical protein
LHGNSATRKTLDPQQLYLDSTSSFHQVFTEEDLDNLRLAGATLRADCNAGTNFAPKKGWYRNLFDLWLVHNGITNFLSLPQLETDGFTVSYHTGGNRIVTTPHGKEITFHQEEDGVCHGFPYIDMQSKAAVAMIQTVRQRYKGFTKREVQDAIAACKAQAMTGHPTDAQFLEMVRNKTIKNCPIKPKHSPPPVCRDNSGRDVCQRHSIPDHAFPKITIGHRQATPVTHGNATQ